MTATAEGVEDGRVEGTGHGALPVGREGVGSDTLGGRAAYIRSISLLSIAFVWRCSSLVYANISRELRFDSK